MKIHNTTYFQQNIQRNKQKQQTQTCLTEPAKPLCSIPVSCIIASRGLNFKSGKTNQFYDEYNWYINHDHTPAIDAFLKIEGKQDDLDSFLGTVLNTDDRGYQIIDSIVKQPRNSNNITKSLTEKLGNKSENIQFFNPNNPYNQAYRKYINTKFNNSHTLSELLKIRPDWKGEKLLEKHQQLKGNSALEIGTIPKEFPNKHLFYIADYLYQYMENGLKKKKEINALNIDNRNYEFKFFTEGKSDKNVFGVFTPEHKKFVIKMAEPEKRSLDAPFALGTLAKIDTYLTTNRCRNSAPLCYYNHDKNLSVYKYIEHTPATDIYDNNINHIGQHLPDFTSLGLTYNDTVGNKNYFLLDENSNEDLHKTEGFHDAINNNEWISVDNDHVTYSSLLQPKVSEYTEYLPNAMQMFF